jgi:hypothetical protein
MHSLQVQVLNAFRKVAPINHFGFGHHPGQSDDVFQLTNVARPRIPGQSTACYNALRNFTGGEWVCLPGPCAHLPNLPRCDPGESAR